MVQRQGRKAISNHIPGDSISDQQPIPDSFHCWSVLKYVFSSKEIFQQTILDINFIVKPQSSFDDFDPLIKNGTFHPIEHLAIWRLYEVPLLIKDGAYYLNPLFISRYRK